MSVKHLGTIFCVLLVLAGAGHVFSAKAQSTETAETEATAKASKQRAEAVEALQTLSNLLTARRDQLRTIKNLKSQLRVAKEDASKEELENEIKSATAKLNQIELQVSALSTGASVDQIDASQVKKFDLTSELQNLAEPFVRMMKDATENARQIEKLRGTIETADKRKRIAERSLKRLSDLTTVSKEESVGEMKEARAHLTTLIKVWEKRLGEANDLRKTTEQQLAVRLDEKANAGDGLGTYATQFFRNRGLNLLLAIVAFTGVFVAMNLIARLAEWVRKRRRIRRSFLTRLIGLVHMLVTLVVAFLAMLAVFNAMNDWLLIGIASVFAVAAAWVGIKMLPTIVEQITLLLNLGAVQEGERVMYRGVPWLVQRLDFYTDLVNPELDGGTFTMPARELIGLHSRPSAAGEAWFPTSKGSWVQLSDGHIGQVLSQTPELVQIREFGGAIRTYETTAFVSEAPRNLSHGYRMKTEFGLDYRHQAIATDEIPNTLQTHIYAGVVDMVGAEGVINLDVDLLRADDSALIFEVEADIAGRLAPRYEDIEREIARLLVDACNKHSWVIPYPQLVVHRGAKLNT